MNTKFYTGTGDDGVSRVGKQSIPKNSAYAACVGSLDELNSWTGLCRSQIADSKVHEILRGIQEALFTAQAYIGSKGFHDEPKQHITAETIVWLEDTIKDIDGTVPELTHFVVPGASYESSLLDVARAVARRAERDAVAFHNETSLDSEFLQFLNRLSSAYFALARYINHTAGISEDGPRYAQG